MSQNISSGLISLLADGKALNAEGDFKYSTARTEIEIVVVHLESIRQISSRIQHVNPHEHPRTARPGDVLFVIPSRVVDAPE